MYIKQVYLKHSPQNMYDQNDNRFNAMPNIKDSRSNQNYNNFNPQVDRRNDTRNDDYQNEFAPPQRKMNFNPSFDPNPNLVPQNNYAPDQFETKKKKHEYADFLKDQMREKEAKKLERSENNNPRQQQIPSMQIQQQQQQQPEYNPSFEKAVDNRKKNEYGEYLRNQVIVVELN
jgi:hypothetical protein